VEWRQAEAAELTRAAQSRADALESILHTGLAHDPQISFERLRLPLHPKPFNPDALGIAAAPPRWEAFTPPEPSGLGKLFGRGAHEQALVQARQRFADEVTQHEARELDRLAALADAQRRHAEAEAWRRQEIEKTNAEVDTLANGFRAGEPQAIEDYFELVVESSPLPGGLPVDADVAYQPEVRRLLVVRELPNADAIPDVVEYKYVRTRDEIDAKARSPRDVKQRYTGVIAQVALLTMRDVFAIQPRSIIDEVAVTGLVSTRNKATGQPERLCLVSVAATREQFDQLVLTELEPGECLRYLNALVSPHPYDLEPVRPVFDPDLSKYRIITELVAAVDLDSRTVLLELRPFEFEVLTKQLFEAMGMKAWVTQASRDDGVDAVAVNEDPIMGGVCVIQAKRYSNVVPIEAVRALAGTMDDKRASRGVLVTTSSFGKASHEFANRHGRIQLIEGRELKHLIAEHLKQDVIIGELKRRTRD
jgi:restriction system protein